MTDEKQLLSGLKKQKRGSLEKIIDIYTPYVSVIIYNIIGTAMTVEDIEEAVADTFVALWRSASAIDENKGSIRSYLAAVARNCARKKLHGAKMHASLDENITALSCSEPDKRAEEKEEITRLIKLIKELGEPDAEIFLRHHIYGERISKISASTGICKSTITTKLHRGRTKLKEILTEEVQQ